MCSDQNAVTVFIKKKLHLFLNGAGVSIQIFQHPVIPLYMKLRDEGLQPAAKQTLLESQMPMY